MGVLSTDLLRGNWCNGFWENMLWGSCQLVADLLQRNCCNGPGFLSGNCPLKCCVCIFVLEICGAEVPVR